nr:hypothetical protein [Tanacetum cinerariifolium]
MNTTQAQQKALDDALVDLEDQVPAIYMQEFWAKTTVHKSSIRFTINKKKFPLDVEVFREILQICPKILGQWFEDLILKQDILSFIRNLGHSRDIICLTDVKNKEVKKTNKMSYPMFTKIIIDYFMSKDRSLSRRNKMFWHTTRDDTMFTIMRCVSRYEKSQVYEKALEENYVRKKADSNISPKKKTTPASKGSRLKSSAKVAKTDKKKQPAKMPKTKGLDILTEVALTKAKQIKLATKRRKNDFHMSHTSGSGDRVDTQSKIPAEQQQKVSGTNEVASVRPEVPNATQRVMKNLGHLVKIMMMLMKKQMWMMIVKKLNMIMMEMISLTLTCQLIKQMLRKKKKKQIMKMCLLIRECQHHQNMNSLKKKKKINRMKESVDVAVQLQTNKLREEAQAENQEFLNQVDSTMITIIKEQVQAQVSKTMPKIEKYVTESLGGEVLVRSTNQPQTSYAVAASLLEIKLKKTLIDKMEENKSINRSDLQKNLYNALVESYNSDKDIINSYDDVVTFKRGRDDQDKDEDPSAESN